MKPLLLLVFTFVITGSAVLADDGWLGVQLQALDSEMAKALQLPDDQGVLVDDVVGESPAEKAGLKHGDVIVAFQGDPVREVKDLTKAVRKASPGDEVAVTVLRDGKRQDLEITLGELENREVFVIHQGEGDGRAAWTGEDGKRLEIYTSAARGGYLGIGMQDLTEQLGKHFGVEGGEGVLVSEVKPDTPAARAGIEAGDVIVKVGSEAVAGGSDLREALASVKPGDEATFEVVRDGRDRTLSAKLAEWPESAGLEAKDVQVYLDKMSGGSPRMREFMPPEHVRELRVTRPDGDVESLRQDVEQLRKDLETMRQELKNR
jgi:S1-C subfamily serine protease